MPDYHNYSLPMSSPGITKVHPVLLFPVVAFQRVCTKTQISKSALCDVAKGRDNSATLLQQHFLPLMTVKKVNRPSQLHSQQEAINRGLKMHLSGDLRSHFFFFFNIPQLLKETKRQPIQLGTWNSIFQVKKYAI